MRLAMRVVGVPVFGSLAALLLLWGVVLIARAFDSRTDTAAGVVAAIGGALLFLAWLFGATAVALVADAGARLWRVLVAGAVAGCVVTILLAEAMGSPVLMGLGPLGALVAVALVQMQDPREAEAG